MGTCQQINKNSKYLKIELHKYPQFVSKSKIDDLGDETKIESFLNEFKIKKEELQKLCPKLHKIFFEDKIKIKENIFKYDGLTNEENELFFYFFNKFQKDYQKKKIKFTNSTVRFPLFEKQNPPEKERKSSEVEIISLTRCKLIFNGNDDNEERYNLLNNCTHLELSYNGLTFLPAAIKNCTKLQKLYLRRNNLSELPSTITELNELEELDLSENKFTKLQKEIFELIKLQWLNMNNNELESFEYENDDYIKKCQLKQLFLAQNKLKTFPKFVLELPCIEDINLENNQIDDIDEIDVSLWGIIKISNGIFEKKKKGSVQNKKLMKNANQSFEPAEGETQKETDNPLQTPNVNPEVQKINENPKLETILIKNPKGQIEAKFNDKMTKIVENFPNESKDDNFLFCEQIETIGELSDDPKNIPLRIENSEFKSRFKEYLTIYRLKKDYILTGTYNLPLELNDKKNEIENYIKKFETKKSKTDFENLHFITKLCKLIATDKVKIYMQYLGNIDYVIKQNLYNLWNQGTNEKKEKQGDKQNKKIELSNKKGFIIMLTELKQFINDVYENFEKITKKKRNTFQIKYLFDKLVPENNPNDIISNEKTKNILLRLGTIIYELTYKNENKEKKKDKEKVSFLHHHFYFECDINHHLKQKQFLDFLERFIPFVKSLNYEN